MNLFGQHRNVAERCHCCLYLPPVHKVGETMYPTTALFKMPCQWEDPQVLVCDPIPVKHSLLLISPSPLVVVSFSYLHQTHLLVNCQSQSLHLHPLHPCAAYCRSSVIHWPKSEANELKNQSMEVSLNIIRLPVSFHNCFNRESKTWKCT